MTKTAIVWTKLNSMECAQAVTQLRKLGYQVEERNCSLKQPWTLAQMKATVPNATTVPQIVIDGVAIGGLRGIAALTEAVATRATAQAKRTTMAQHHAQRKAAHAATVSARTQSKVDRQEARLAIRAAAQPVPALAPEGYQTSAPRTATTEQNQARFDEKAAARTAALLAKRDATRDQRHAAYAAQNDRIAAAIQAQIQAHKV